MRILKVIHGYPPLYSAGSEVYSQSICEELSKRHEVVVFSREENPFAPDMAIRITEVHPGLAVHLVNMPRAKDGYRHAELDARFSELVRSFKPDVAHIGHLNHLSTGIVDVLERAGIPIVFTLHDFWLMCPRGQFLQRNFGQSRLHELCDGQEDRKCATTCYSSAFSGVDGRTIDEEVYWSKWVATRMDEMRGLASAVDLFIAPSKYLRTRIIDEFGVEASKVMYLDYGFPTDYLVATTKRDAYPKFRFGYIGTHIPAKGVNMLIEAFDGLGDAAELFIWGAKDQQSTAALQAMAASRKDIHFMGAYVNQNLANEVFNRVDCIVVPSIWMENSPLVIHEAQACGIPVITAEAGGMAEYVQHEVNGLLFRHRSIEDLREQMRWACMHPAEMERLGRRGYLFSTTGGVPSIVDHCAVLEDVYTQLIARS